MTNAFAHCVVTICATSFFYFGMLHGIVLRYPKISQINFVDRTLPVWRSG